MEKPLKVEALLQAVQDLFPDSRRRALERLAAV